MPNHFYVHSILSLNLSMFLNSHGFTGPMLGMVSLEAKVKKEPILLE